MSTALLDLHAVEKTFGTGGIFSGRQSKAVDGVSFALDAGGPEIFTIIGESGSGKTTLARMVLNTLSPTSGVIRFRGVDLASLRSRRAHLAFMGAVQPIFQNPFETFNPLKKIDRYLFATAHRFAGAATPSAQERLADGALGKVGLSLAEVRGRFPHELSGGQLQRTAVARALIPGPSLIVADEPVSMVDASLRMSIVTLFRTLCDESGVSILYITHDLATAYTISDRIIIMREGRVVESGDARTVLTSPRHPYAIRLKEAVLSPGAAATGGLPVEKPPASATCVSDTPSRPRA